MTVRERRLVTLAAVVIPGLIAARFVVPAWRAWAVEASRARAELETEVTSTANRLARLPATLDTLEIRTRQLMRLMPTFVLGEPTAEAVALLRDLEVQAGSLGLAVLSSAVAVDTVTAGTTSISVRLDGEGDIVGVSNWLRVVEEREPTLVIRKLTIQPADVGVAQHAPESLMFAVRLEAMVYEVPDWSDRP